MKKPRRVSLFRSPQGPYLSTLLGEYPWLEHAFGTAVAPPPSDSLLLKQIHSDRVLEASAARRGGEVEGDALVTAEAGSAIAVKTADCVSILMVDPRNRAIAAVHAGWKGTLAAIAARALEKMAALYGTRAADVRAAFGPSIGPCCFEVGPEVAVLFQALFPERADLSRQTTLDLREANRRVLAAAGVPTAQIDAQPPCSCCAGPQFYSWRRDHLKGERMFSRICLKR